MGVVERPRVTRDVSRRRPAGRVRTQRGYTTMANRRKFLAGLGALASGSAAAVGTGAFTSVSADRSVNVSVADDSDALLAFETSSADNSAYADTSGAAVSIDITDSNDSGFSSGADPSGVNPNATTQINDIFKVRNQGSQAVVVYVEPSSIGTSNRTDSPGFGVDPQASNRPNGDFTNTSNPLSEGIEDDQISLTGGYSTPPYEYSAYVDDQEQGTADAIEEFVLESGEAFDFGLYVNSGSSTTTATVNMDIVADATLVPGSIAGQDS